MVNIDDTPSDVIPDPDMAWMLPNEDRQQQIYAVCDKIVAKYVDLKYHGKHSESVGANRVFGEVSITSSGCDGIQQYASQILSLGCFYLEFCDAIKEGDGDRILRCWRYLLPIFKGSDERIILLRQSSSYVNSVTFCHLNYHHNCFGVEQSTLIVYQDETSLEIYRLST